LAGAAVLFDDCLGFVGTGQNKELITAPPRKTRLVSFFLAALECLGQGNKSLHQPAGLWCPLIENAEVITIE